MPEVPLHRLADQLLGLAVGDEDEGNRVSERVGPQPFAEGESVQAGAHCFADDGAGRVGLDGRQRALPILAHLHDELRGVADAGASLPGCDAQPVQRGLLELQRQLPAGMR